MANPRRISYSGVFSSPNIQSSENNNNNRPFQAQTLVSSLKLFLKKPHAFPFLLSLFILLAWVSLRLQHHTAHFSFSSSAHQQQQQLRSTAAGGGGGGGGNTESRDDDDRKANLVRFPSRYPSRIIKDQRGWLLNPLSVALDAGISGGAVTCASVHLGEIQPGAMRGNHRHYTCNETFLIWGAKTIFRLENNAVDGGYAEVTVNADEVAVAASPHGLAHALLNVDPVRSTFFMGCQDSVINYGNSTTDFNVWKDL